MIHEPYSAFYMAQVGEFVMEAVEAMNLRETSQGFMQKERKPYGLYTKIWKEIFLCRNRSPSLWNC
ncbi:hypothetical protein R3W88_030160 [Solanum pinnatisectum]|uniref:Uncharacterized protein n=1 Tax=Solanum pinnatisectum TaxID=50273 RepID=A0AAV9K9P5_9SOLN|nr:hypothetical protein R3W88_030160 [Solanum pinnatisectum]